MAEIMIAGNTNVRNKLYDWHTCAPDEHAAIVGLFHILGDSCQWQLHRAGCLHWHRRQLIPTVQLFKRQCPAVLAGMCVYREGGRGWGDGGESDVCIPLLQCMFKESIAQHSTVWRFRLLFDYELRCWGPQDSLPLILEDGSVDAKNSLFLCSYSLIVLWVVLQVPLLINKRFLVSSALFTSP